LWAALVSLLTAGVVAMTPLVKAFWRSYRIRHFDPKKEHHRELIEQAKWYELRSQKLEILRNQLPLHAGDQPLDRFRLAELISKLDRADSEWARRAESAVRLAEACLLKEQECARNAENCYEAAERLLKSVIFW